MRVGLVIYGSIETLTGRYLYDRRLLDHLVSRGDRAEVISLPRRNHYPRALCDNASPSLVRRLTRARFDVLLQDELVHPSLVFLNGWLRARARYPIVTIVHLLRSSEQTATRLRGWYAAAERRYLATVDAALYNSETTQRAVEALLGRGLPGVIAYPGGDHLAVERSEAELAAQARATGPLCVLSIANVLPGKGLCVLIDALCRLPTESWRLQIVGSLTMDRPYVDRLRGLIARAGLATHVCLVGTVPNARIPEYLVRSHLLVVPSHYEALGIAYLEAMRFGLPVIATTAGGAHEIVGHGREGFLVVPGDADALTRHLRLLIADRELLLRMGLAARRRAARHPTWDQSFERARIFLRSLVETHRAKGSGVTMVPMADESSPSDVLFEVVTPLNFRVHVTRAHWQLITTVKHPVMATCESEVRETLRGPDEIRLSRSDPKVYLFYKQRRLSRWVCAVAKRLNGDGFLVTTYPTDGIKEGINLWPK